MVHPAASMRVAINAFPLRNNGGGARYVFTALLDAMLRQESTNTYLVFAHLEGLRLIHQVIRNQPNPSDIQRRVRVIEIGDEGQMLGFRDEFDVLFGPLNNLKPRLYDRPTVAILHDIQEQYFPEYFAQSELIGRAEEYPEICRSATTLIAISQFCKQSFVDKLGIDPRKIEVVYNAPQANLVDRDASDQGRWTKKPLPPRFLFYPANNYPHKNHALLLEAMETLQNDGLSLVLSGHEVLGGYPVMKQIAARGLSDKVLAFTELSADEMRHLYCHAVTTVLPTLFEGFGMPAVEAMACGCPVVCTDLPALREIAADSALYFPPNDAPALIAQVRRVSADPQIRQQALATAETVTHRFNWAASADRVLEILRQAPRRFRHGYRDATLHRRPRIGVLVRLSQAGYALPGTLHSLIAVGYPDLIVRVVGRHLSPAALKPLLQSLDAKHVDVELTKSDDVQLLRDFSEQEGLDLIVEANEGQTFKPSAFDSIAWAVNENPEKLLYMGEAMEWRKGHFVQIARMRLTGDGLWKLEGFLHPELMFLRPEALPSSPPSGHSRKTGEIHWRWQLLQQLRASDQLMLTRRTVADCDTGWIGMWDTYLAARAGMFNFYSTDTGQAVRVNFLRRLEPMVKAAARALPMRWQDRGTRLWYRLSR